MEAAKRRLDQLATQREEAHDAAKSAAGREADAARMAAIVKSDDSAEDARAAAWGWQGEMVTDVCTSPAPPQSHW